MVNLLSYNYDRQLTVLHSLYSTLCSAEITFKTDPKNTDYAAEHGASRNFEPWRDEAAEEEVDRLARLEEEENNPMKALENRTTDSKREMDILDALQDIRARNARNERMGKLDAGEIVERLVDKDDEEDREETEEERRRREEEEEDDRLVREVFSKVAVPSRPGPSGTSTTEGENTDKTEEPRMVTLKRKALDLEEKSLDSLLPESTRSLVESKINSASSSTAAKTAGAGPTMKKKKLNALGIKVVPKKVAVK
jgi:hypothetical protein